MAIKSSTFGRVDTAAKMPHGLSSTWTKIQSIPWLWRR